MVAAEELILGARNDADTVTREEAAAPKFRAGAKRISQTAVASMPFRPMHRRAEAPYLSLMDERLRYASIGCAVCVAASPWVWLVYRPQLMGHRVEA